MKKYIELMRIKHWLKNILVFLPLFFSGNINNTKLLFQNFIAFIIFCFTSSIIYIINDICDIKNDILHPIKKNRPLASKKVSIKKAIYLILLLLVFTSIALYYLYTINSNIYLIIIPLIYIVLNVLYSKGLKNIAIIDVLILVIGFVLRVIFGGLTVNVVTSKYLYLMIIFGSYYLSFGKRRGEYIKNGDISRNVLEKYNKPFLEKNMYVAFSLTIVSYTLWCVDPEVTSRIEKEYMFFTIPLLITILQLYSLNIEKDSYADPVDVILHDKSLLISVAIYITIMILLIYL